MERPSFLGLLRRITVTLILGFFFLPTISGACLSLTGTSVKQYRTAKYAEVTWGVSTMATGCSVLNWMVHYDSVNPIRIFKNRNNTGSNVNQTYIPVVPNFKYNVFVEAFTNQGVVRSPLFVYQAPKARPDVAPGKLRMLSKTHDSVTLAWDKVSVFNKGGDVLGYQLAYRAVGTANVVYVNVTGENTLTEVIPGLQPSTTYQIIVQCINDIGMGPASRPWLTITTNPLPTTTPTTTTTPSTTSTTTPSTTTTTATTTTTSTTPTKTTVTTAPPNTSLRTITPATNKVVPIGVSPANVVSSPKTASSANTVKQSSPHSQVTRPPDTSSIKPVISSATVTSRVTKRPPTPHKPSATTTEPAKTRQASDDGKFLGLDLWMLIAIAVGILLLLVLLSLLLCCCCRCCCFEEAAVGAKTRAEERVFDKRKMDGVFTERDTRREDVSRKQRTRSVVSMESLDGYRVSEGKPRAMRLVSVDSHHSLDAVPILIPSSAGRYSSRHTTPMGKAAGTQYERIHTTPMARNAGTQYEDTVDRVIYPTPKSKTFGTQYESIEEEMPTKEIGTITDRHGSITPDVSQPPSKMSSARTPRTLRAVAPMQINPEVLAPVVVKTIDASTSAMSSPERRYKSANVQTDLSVLQPATPLPQSFSASTKSASHQSLFLPKDTEAEIDLFPHRSVPGTDTNSLSVPPTAVSDHRVPFDDIASCPTAVPLRPQDIPRTRDHSYLRYPSKAASHPLTLWDIPLKSYPDSITHPSMESSGDVSPSINRIEYNMIYDNRVSNTDNTYIHNFLEDTKKMARKPKVSRPPRLAPIPGNVESPVGMYDPFPEKSDAYDLIKPGMDKQTTFNNIPAVKGPEVRAILYEPHRKKDSTDC